MERCKYVRQLCFVFASPSLRKTIEIKLALTGPSEFVESRAMWLISLSLFLSLSLVITHVHAQYIHTNRHTQTHAQHTDLCTHTHTHKQTHKHTLTHTHAKIHIHAHRQTNKQTFQLFVPSLPTWSLNRVVFLGWCGKHIFVFLFFGKKDKQLYLIDKKDEFAISLCKILAFRA